MRPISKSYSPTVNKEAVICYETVNSYSCLVLPTSVVPNGFPMHSATVIGTQRHGKNSKSRRYLCSISYLFQWVLRATTKPRLTGASCSNIEGALSIGVIQHHIAVGTAIIYRANLSSTVSGKIVRLLEASPCWSYISWVLTVLKIMQAMTNGHQP